jgi:hypothetical protein
MKPQIVIGIDGSLNDPRNGWEHILDIVEVGNGRVVDFEIVQKDAPSGRGSYQGSGNVMEVEAMRRMVKRWEGGQKQRFW